MTVICKITYGDETRRFELADGRAVFEDFQTRVKATFGVAEVRSLKVYDEDNDLLTLDSDEELRAAIERAEGSPLRFVLVPEPAEPQQPAPWGRPPPPPHFGGPPPQFWRGAHPHGGPGFHPHWHHMHGHHMHGHGMGPRGGGNLHHPHHRRFGNHDQHLGGEHLGEHGREHGRHHGRHHGRRHCGERHQHRQHGPNGRLAMRTGGKRLARFVHHVSIPDGTVFAPGARFTKIWQVRNDTNEREWPDEAELIWIGGEDALLAEGGGTVKVGGGLAPGAEREVAIDLVAPKLPGQYSTYFRLRGPQGHRFGQRLWCEIIVAVPDASGGGGANAAGRDDDDDTSSISSVSSDDEWEELGGGEGTTAQQTGKKKGKKDKKKQGKCRARAEKALLKKRKRVETKVRKVKARLAKLESRLANINGKLAAVGDAAAAPPATPPIPSAIVVAEAEEDMAKLDISEDA